MDEEGRVEEVRPPGEPYDVVIATERTVSWEKDLEPLGAHAVRRIVQVRRTAAFPRVGDGGVVVLVDAMSYRSTQEIERRSGAEFWILVVPMSMYSSEPQEAVRLVMEVLRAGHGYIASTDGQDRLVLSEFLTLISMTPAQARESSSQRFAQPADERPRGRARSAPPRQRDREGDGVGRVDLRRVIHAVREQVAVPQPRPVPPTKEREEVELPEGASDAWARPINYEHLLETENGE